jgi:hypothetical protein
MSSDSRIGRGLVIAVSLALAKSVISPFDFVVDQVSLRGFEFDENVLNAQIWDHPRGWFDAERGVDVELVHEDDLPHGRSNIRVHRVRLRRVAHGDQVVRNGKRWLQILRSHPKGLHEKI